MKAVENWLRKLYVQFSLLRFHSDSKLYCTSLILHCFVTIIISFYRWNCCYLHKITGQAGYWLPNGTEQLLRVFMYYSIWCWPHFQLFQSPPGSPRETVITVTFTVPCEKLLDSPALNLLVSRIKNRGREYGRYRNLAHLVTSIGDRFSSESNANRRLADQPKVMSWPWTTLCIDRRGTGLTCVWAYILSATFWWQNRYAALS